MPLTLTIQNVKHLDNGSPLSLVLDRRGAVVGRAATTDWCLPDPSLNMSSRHLEIRFVDGRYELLDISTNGTFLHGQAARLAVPHVIKPGDVFVAGTYEIAAALDDAAAAAAAEINAVAAEPQWQGWASHGNSGDSAAPAIQSSWDAIPGGSAISGTGPMAQNWAPPSSTAAHSPLEPSGSTWDVGPAPAPAPGASDWSAPIAAAPPAGGADIWGKFEESNVVDWARGGFGSPPAPPPAPANPLGLSNSSSSPLAAVPLPAPPRSAQPNSAALDHAGAVPNPQPQPQPVPLAPSPSQPHIAAGAGLAVFAVAAGVELERIKQGEAEILAQAGDLVRRVIAGLVVMLEARARAKSQMGAQSTNLELHGNNPLKFARTPEQALAQLLNPPERGFMSSELAIEDAFKDLQAHQVATLRAMQGALRATLERFSPKAIRGRAEKGGLLSRILPGARDAALWAAYEKEFGGVAHGSDEAFMDMFAKEFRRAYDEISSKR